MIKHGYYHSNHVNADQQILNCYNRLHQFRMRELNLTQLSLEAETDDISHVSTVFTSMLPREERLKVQKENRVKKQQPVAAIEEESATFS